MKVFFIFFLLISHLSYAQSIDYEEYASKRGEAFVIPTGITGNFILLKFKSPLELKNHQDVFTIDYYNRLLFKKSKLEYLLRKSGSKTFTLFFEDTSESLTLKLMAVGVMTHDHKPLPRESTINASEIGSFALKIHNPQEDDRLEISNLIFSDWKIEKYARKSIEDYKKYYKKLIQLRPYDFREHKNSIWILGYKRPYYKFFRMRDNEAFYLKEIVFKYQGNSYELNITTSYVNRKEAHYRYERGPNWDPKEFQAFEKALQTHLKNKDVRRVSNPLYLYKAFLTDYIEKNDIEAFSFFAIIEEGDSREVIPVIKDFTLEDFRGPFEIYGLNSLKIITKENNELKMSLSWIKKHLNTKLKNMEFTFYFEPEEDVYERTRLDGFVFSQYGSYHFGEFCMFCNPLYQEMSLNNVTFGDGDYFFMGVEEADQVTFGSGSYEFFGVKEFSRATFGGGEYLLCMVENLVESTLGNGHYQFLDAEEDTLLRMSNTTFKKGSYYFNQPYYTFEKCTVGEGDFIFERKLPPKISKNDFRFNYSGKRGKVEFLARDRSEIEKIFKNHKNLD